MTKKQQANLEKIRLKKAQYLKELRATKKQARKALLDLAAANTETTLSRQKASAFEDQVENLTGKVTQLEQQLLEAKKVDVDTVQKELEETKTALANAKAQMQDADKAAKEQLLNATNLLEQTKKEYESKIASLQGQNQPELAEKLRTTEEALKALREASVKGVQDRQGLAKQLEASNAELEILKNQAKTGDKVLQDKVTKLEADNQKLSEDLEALKAKGDPEDLKKQLEASKELVNTKTARIEELEKEAKVIPLPTQTPQPPALQQSGWASRVAVGLAVLATIAITYLWTENSHLKSRRDSDIANAVAKAKAEMAGNKKTTESESSPDEVVMDKVDTTDPDKGILPSFLAPQGTTTTTVNSNGITVQVTVPNQPRATATAAPRDTFTSTHKIGDLTVSTSASGRSANGPEVINHSTSVLVEGIRAQKDILTSSNAVEITAYKEEGSIWRAHEARLGTNSSGTSFRALFRRAPESPKP